MKTLYVTYTPLWLFASWLTVASFARAQMPEPHAPGDALNALTQVDAEPDGYRDLVDEAVREYERGHFEEARTLFVRAHQLFPNARTHRGIGKAEFELRNYESCVEHLDAALRATARPLTTELRVETEQLLARAQDFFGTLRIETKPSASEIRIDGVPVAIGSGQSLSVRVGEHVVEVDAPGYELERRPINVQGGPTEQLVIVFTRPLSGPVRDERAHGWRRSPWLWTAVGVVVAGAAAGSALAIRGGGERHGPYDRGSSGSLGKAP